MNLDYNRRSSDWATASLWSVSVCNATNNNGLCQSVSVCNATNNNGIQFSIIKIFGFVYATAASTCSCSPDRA